MQEIKTEKGKIIKSWCSDLESEAQEQMMIIADQPFIFNHVSLMPDAHIGMSMPIGGVVATKDVIIPQWIGSDIGCGMGAIKTSLKVSDFKDGMKEELHHSMGRSIPVGFNHNNDKRRFELTEKYNDKIEYLFEKNKNIFDSKIQIFKDIREEVAAQLSTLGGG